MSSDNDKKFPMMMGFVDGFLTALTLAAGRLFEKEHAITWDLAVRVGIASLVSSGFVFFVARYSELRRGLIEAERQLSLGRPLVKTTLGRKTLVTSVIDASLSGVSSFVGAFVPLFIGVFDPWIPWGTLVSSCAILGFFGFALGTSLGNRAWIWCAALIAGGILVIWIGNLLHLT